MQTTITDLDKLVGTHTYADDYITGWLRTTILVVLLCSPRQNDEELSRTSSDRAHFQHA
jgi:hypothetical protein